MNVTFLATIPPMSSTIVGRTIPLARAVAQRGHDAQIITLGPQLESRTESGIRVEVVGPSLRRWSSARPPVWQTPSLVWQGRAVLRAALARAVSDVVVLVKPHPQNVWAMAGTRIPVILDADDDERWAVRATWLERLVIDRVDRQAAHRADIVTVASPALVDRYTRELRARKVLFLPTGIEPQDAPVEDPRFREDKDPRLRGDRHIRARLGVAPDAPVILYLGSIALSSGHRVDALLDVWDELAERHATVHLVLAGDGIDLERMKARAQALRHHTRVHFLGRFAAEAAEGLARQATVLVDPVDDTPASRAKSSSRTLLALRTGVPIVAGDVGIRQTFLPPSVRAWALTPAGNRARLLSALDFALTPEARKKFQDETRDLWQQWTWEKLGATFVTALEVLHA